MMTDRITHGMQNAHLYNDPAATAVTWSWSGSSASCCSAGPRSAWASTWQYKATCNWLWSPVMLAGWAPRERCRLPPPAGTRQISAGFDRHLQDPPTCWKTHWLMWASWLVWWTTNFILTCCSIGNISVCYITEFGSAVAVLPTGPGQLSNNLGWGSIYFPAELKSRMQDNFYIAVNLR